MQEIKLIHVLYLTDMYRPFVLIEKYLNLNFKIKSINLSSSSDNLGYLNMKYLTVPGSVLWNGMDK